MSSLAVTWEPVGSDGRIVALKLADLFHTLATSRQEAVALDVELAAASLESDPESNKELELEKRRRSTVGASSRPSIMSLPMEPTNEEGEALQQVQSPTADVSMFGSAQPSQETAANIRPTADEPMTTESQQDQAMKDAPGEPPQPTVEARQKQVAEWERQNDMREVLHTTYSKLDKASKLSPGLGAMHELRDFNR